METPKYAHISAVEMKEIEAEFGRPLIQLEFRRRVKTQAALPNEGAVLRVFFGLWISGQMQLHRINGDRDIGGRERAAA